MRGTPPTRQLISGGHLAQANHNTIGVGPSGLEPKASGSKRNAYRIIAERFADQFVVKANGRVHPANHSNYLTFLNGFRSTIHAIDYDVQEVVAEGSSAVLAMTATVVRLDETTDQFEAMLLLKFDETDRITLWHEVYLKTE